MKKQLQIIFTIMLGFLLATALKAQLPIIDSLEILPAHPTTNDTVRIISHSIFTSGGCPLAASNININGNTICVNVTHTLGMLTVICYSTDTLCIGKLNAKSYDLIYNLSLTNLPAMYDSDTIHFTVQQSTGMHLTNSPEQGAEIYPNPINSEINIRLKTQQPSACNVEIFSLIGRKMKAISESKQAFTIDGSDLADGVYFIVITSGNEKRWTQKMIKKTME